MLWGGSTHVYVGVAVLSILLVIAAVPGAGSHSPAVAFANTGQIDPDTVLLDVVLDSEGDASWEIRYRIRLDDDNATAAFEELERDVEENRSSYANQFDQRMQNTVSVAENATGRDMDVRNVSVRTTRQDIPQRYGVLIYSFEWSNFAAVEGSRITAGDAIGGLYLDESTSLTVQWPSGYDVVSTDPSPDESGDGSVTWRGPADFTTDQPGLVVSPEPAGPEEDGGGSGVPTSLAIGAILVLAVLGTGGWWWSRGRSRDSNPPVSKSQTGRGEAPPDELLSNEERVLRLLRQHGGRMKQQQVVEELQWTDAKTSQVVGDLRESGEIEAFRLGRENVLRLPEAGDGPLDR